MLLRISLLLLAVIAAGCNTSESCDCPAPPDHDVEITQGASIKGPNAFSPANFIISLANKTTVTWLNRDFSGTGPYGGGSGVTHRLVSDDGTTFTSGNIPSNGTFTATLSAPGSYGYHCSIHPAMTGTLTVNP
jgi:plastocyanin